MATIETKYNIGQEVWVISCENLGPDIKKRIVSGITVETIDLRSYENLRNEPIVTYGGFCYRTTSVRVFEPRMSMTVFSVTT